MINPSILCLVSSLFFWPGGKDTSGRSNPVRPMAALSQVYDKDLVEVVNMRGQYDAVFMSRKNNRIKAKYFAASMGGTSIQQRFREWSTGRNIVMYCSGTYMDYNKRPVGLTIDNGILVNANMEDDWDGLVIVYATGGVVATNLDEGDLSMTCNGVNTRYNLRQSQLIRQQFIRCAEKESATVFQTHLLVQRDKVLVAQNAKRDPRERRFLAVCEDKNTPDKVPLITHVIVNVPKASASTLGDATNYAVEAIHSYGAGNIVFMVNLDVGWGDVFKLYNADGTVRMEGPLSLESASNLLVYYYE